MKYWLTNQNSNKNSGLGMNKFKCGRSNMGGILIFLLFIIGCTENVPPKDDVESPDNVAAVETNYLPYEVLSFSTERNFSSALALVNSQNPTSTDVPEVISTGTEIQVLTPRFNQGGYNAATRELTDYRLNTLLFTQDDKFYQLDLQKVIEPQRVQLSSEFQTSSICHGWDIWAEDFTNFENSRYIYYIANDCQSNIGKWFMVNLSMNEFQSPINLPTDIYYFISSILDSDTGALKGWLVVNQDGLLANYDVELTQFNLVRLNNANFPVTNFSSYIIKNAQNQLLLSIDEKILWYNPLTNLLENSVEVFPATQLSKVYQWQSDGTHLYFTVNHLANDRVTVLSSSLYRVLLENASQADLELLSSETEKITRLEIGSNGVVFSIGNLLKRYSTLTSSITNITPPENYNLSLNPGGIPVFYVSDDMLFAEYSLSGNLTARLILVQSADLQINEMLQNNYIVGVSYQKAWQIDRSRGIDKIVLEREGAGLGSRVISAFTPSEYPLMLTLGELPVDSTPRPLTRFYALGHDDILIQGIFNSVMEVFFIDVNKAGSLIQVTNNQTTERVVNF